MLTVRAKFPDLTLWLRDTFVTGLNRSHAAVQEKLGNMTKLTFEPAVEIAVNTTTVKEHARQLYSPGSATVGVPSSEDSPENRVESTLDR